MSWGDGGPVFPKFLSIGERCLSEGGMTLRDYFAGQALAGMEIRHDGAYSENDHERQLPQRHAERCAAAAYRIADAMLAERDKP